MINTDLIFSYLEEKYPNAHCELTYTKDYEFLIAVMLSAQTTDKAVNPVNVMGATKLLAERLMISSNVYGVKTGTTFSCVRFGNVLNSRGSVIPVFRKQISEGGPITVTDKEMTRFIMDIPDAARLILKAGRKATGGEIFILKMPAVKLTDLSEAMIEYYAPKFGYDPSKIEIEIIGKRIEKLCEVEYAYQELRAVP